MINGDIKFLFSDYPLIMVAQDNNILCRTQDSNTHGRTKDNIMEDRLFGAVGMNIFNKFRIITYKNISICDKYQKGRSQRHFLHYHVTFQLI